MTEPAQSGQALDAALVAHRAGDFSKAESLYRKIHEQQPGDHDASYGLGTVLHQQGKHSEALDLLNQAVAAAPAIPEYAFNRACVLQALGRNDTATHDFMRAAELAAGDPALLVQICRKLISLGHHYAACSLLSAAAQRRPDARIIWINLSLALGRVRDYEAAIECYRRALAMRAGNASEMLAFADLLFMARQPQAASDALLQARQLGDDSASLHYLQARCEKILGHVDEARALLQTAIAKRPTYGHAWQQLLDQTDNGQLPDLIGSCAEIANDEAQKSSDRIVLLYTLGRALERLGDYVMAFEYFQRANELQRADAATRNVRYDVQDAERFVERMRNDYGADTRTASATAADVQPIFIVGMPRSGTTLVERIIGGLDGVETGGESEALELVASQYYWAVDHNRAKSPGELSASAWDQLAQQYWRLQMGPARRLTDKLPTNFRHVGLIAAMFPDARVIHVQRDPRDVGLSIYSRNFADGHPYATEFASIAHCYRVSQQLLAFWKTRYPERIHTLRYEELVKDPEAKTRRLAEFCNLEWRPECLEFHQRNDASFTFSELQVREPLNTKGIGRWRHYAESLEPLLKAYKTNGVELGDT